MVQATTSLLHVGATQLAAYAEAKSRRAVLDYEDLILKTRDLLSRADVAPWILFKLDGGIDHILIDEAQDTSPDQWRIVGALAEEFFAGLDGRDEQRSVFAVGDIKQSIYSFQGADPEQFDAMRGHFQTSARQAELPFRNVPLETSFRSTPAVLAVVDEVFAPEHVREGLTFGDKVVRHESFRQGQAGLVELWPPVVPEPRDNPDAWTPPVVQMGGTTPAEKLADTLAITISGWLDQGEILPSRGRPVKPGDILVLVRRRTEFVEHLVNALKSRNVPVAGADRMVLTEQLAVMDLMALGRFALLPEDDLTLAEVLKGPLVGLNDSDLFDIAHDRGEQSLWSSLRRATKSGGQFSDAETFLAQLLAQADFAPPYEFFSRILGPEGGRFRIVARLGAEANDPIDEFLKLTLDYEQSHAPSLEGFLHWVGAAATEVKRDMEHDRDEVRVMTVHGAKGLEAPIVILPDTTGKPSQDDDFLWLKPSTTTEEENAPELLVWPVRRENEVGPCAPARDQTREAREREYRRLLYVALTRAEDRLYVCGWETFRGRQDGCWYNLIADAVERMDGFEQVAVSDGNIVHRMINPQTAPVEASREALEHAPEQPLPDWALAAPLPDPDPPQPLAPSRPSDIEPPVMSPVDQGEDGVGLIRGRHIHRLLQLLPDLPLADREDAARRYFDHAADGLDAAWTQQMIAEVLSVLDHTEFAPLFGPQSQAEVPIAGVVQNFAVSGQIDRLAVTDDEVLIIDYKTNRRPPADEREIPDAYLNQMAIYQAVISDIFPKHSVRCALLWTEGPALMPISNTLLHERLG